MPHMRPWTERYEEAKRHVADGRLVLERQRALIDRQKVLKRDTAVSERLLATFERSQEIFEGDLARIRQECE
jgi:hypothetical protein